ncbi:protein Shroom1 [Hyla sarda]|uniref:protein Shroom1 n=1 Tax=Hyla sarda TaxID=327740 RepID=UPI0024C3C880|nr:protein Shroom1 [Hyla sarda]XP_056430926.1 protein Shroom1 [Hyla sarda]XP_056430928.1 protein Shroom1 [Hyla sarda]XP_056430929.1 protein Shroom1 [Hyla sarda]XP_056430930.1 protein Shroom1 [Hyla sarda]XP_056430931.1 protein Shroom1 [Hyla sarda]XP_056430932.1 protein Shroom1 [Hyla sarda]XP_056430933.1 protein Shroom1 [Hyla sarda]XP_056430934.1 protein Shroom1 [Hyla sarda]XP_056430935.1 protein Shroom1 [Hyla sarda]XP_056430936.1 protein Shroom1 [Hyla sarda]
MSSFGNAIENWSIRSKGDISDLQHKLVSDGCALSSSPIKAMAAVVDSAYSSFSGSSYVTDYQPFPHGSCHLNEQISYMDSEYVKAIYNPNAEDQKNIQQNLGCENSTSKNYDLSPMRINNYTNLQHFEQSDLNRESENHFSHKSKRSPTSTSDLSSPEHKLCRHYNEDDSPVWVRSTVQGEWTQTRVISCSREEEDYPQSTKLSHNVNCTDIKNNSLSQVSALNTNCVEQKDFQTIHMKREEQNPSNMYTDYCLNEGMATKSTRCSFNELMSEKSEVRSGSWKPAQETNCYNPEGTNSEGIEDLAHTQVCKEQYRPKSQNMKDLECDSIGQWDIKYKGLHTKNSQTLYVRPSEDLFEQPSKALNREVPKTYVRKDATIKPVPLISQEQELSMPLISDFSELTSEKITKASTPMLYHLAGGKNSSWLNFKNQAKHLDASIESKTFQPTGNSSTSQVAEPKRPFHETKSHSQIVDSFVIDSNECDTTGNLTSSEESFMYDYREKLKVAQKKVLRETSFKRKDLQMSLPVRLKWNAPKRPSIDHVRSYSLSGSNEEAKFVQPKAVVDNNYKKEEPEKILISRIGGRKRLTKEQRKLCYSEPEKLDYVGVQNSFSVWNNEGSSEIKLGEHHRMKSTDKERTLSSSNLSKTELKQIQHNALIEYMERKANQRPSSIYQSQTQKLSGHKSMSEWKCLTNEMSSNDLQQPYYHRRSTGASSSYDATVTWNDRILKMSPEDSSNLVDKTVDGKSKSYLNQSPLSNNKCYFEDSAAVSLKNLKSVNQNQVSAGHLTSSTSALTSKNHVCDNRLSATMDSTAYEKEEVCNARARGKSMEELGSSDRIRLSMLSQSSEQLSYIKGSVLSTQSENARSTSVVHQDMLKASPEPRSRPRQTSKEDLLEPHRSAHERQSSPQTSSGISSPSQFKPRTTEQSQYIQTENEAFAQPNIISTDDALRPPNMSVEDPRQPIFQSEEVQQARSPVHMHSQLLQAAMSMRTPSFEANEKSVPWYDNKVKAEVNDLGENSVFKGTGISVTENQDSGEVNEESQSTNSEPIRLVQQKNFDIASSSHKNGTEIASSSTHGENNANDEAFGQKSCMKEQGDAPRENSTTLKSQTEERYTELVKEITTMDKSLVDVLKPLPVRESAMGLMKSLFSVDISTREHSRNRELKNNTINTEGLSKSHSRTMLPEKFNNQKPGVESLDNITLLKIELISSITSLLEELCGEKELLISEISKNTNHGTNIDAVVKEVCKPNEYERYMMFIGDLEKVVSLLFCLSVRLARVENALSKIDKDTDAEEMQSLKERHNLLSRQREDAKDLKDNLDRRQQVVTGILAKYLSEAQLEDYRYFVRLKTSLLIEQKDLDEKIKFHEEQLETLQNSISP